MANYLKEVEGGEIRHMFDVAIRWADVGKAQLAEMATHKFALSDLEGIMETNLDKTGQCAVETVVSFS